MGGGTKRGRGVPRERGDTMRNGGGTKRKGGVPRERKGTNIVYRIIKSFDMVIREQIRLSLHLGRF